MLHANEIDIEEVETGQPLEYLITPAGIAAYADKKYLTEGMKERMRVILEWIQITSTVILLILGIWAFIDNTIQARKASADVDQLEKRLRQIEQRIYICDPSKKTQ